MTLSFSRSSRLTLTQTVSADLRNPPELQTQQSSLYEFDPRRFCIMIFDPFSKASLSESPYWSCKVYPSLKNSLIWSQGYSSIRRAPYEPEDLRLLPSVSVHPHTCSHAHHTHTYTTWEHQTLQCNLTSVKLFSCRKGVPRLTSPQNHTPAPLLNRELREEMDHRMVPGMRRLLGKCLLSEDVTS